MLGIGETRPIGPDPLDDARELFRAGSVNDAAKLLHFTRETARANARVDLLVQVDDLVDRMRAQLAPVERQQFDEVLERGESEVTAREVLARLWVVLSPLVWAAIWLVYYLQANPILGGNCGPEGLVFGPLGRWEGGGYESELAAAVVGALLLAVGGLTAWHVRKRPGTVMFAFAGTYVVALVVLWFVSPAIWGPRHCVIPD